MTKDEKLPHVVLSGFFLLLFSVYALNEEGEKNINNIKS